MCGRYTFVNTSDLAKRFDAKKVPSQLTPSYNIAPGSHNPTIIRQSPNQAILMKWGLVPHWAKDPNIGYKLINARAETIHQKPSFRHAFSTQRCLIPTSGFYEWDRSDENKKIPYYFCAKDRSLFAFAGLYNTYKDAEGHETPTYTIITTKAKGVVAKIHDRMPVILKKEIESDWLDPNIHDQKKLLKILTKTDHQSLVGYPVSTKVNKASENEPELLSPIGKKL